MLENKSYLVFALRVVDLSVARYLAAKGTDYIGIPVDPENFKRTQHTILQFKEWLEGPKLIGICERTNTQMELEYLDGYYHPDCGLFYHGKLDQGLLKSGKPELSHDHIFQIFENPPASSTPFPAFLTLDLRDDPRNHRAFRGFAIQPGFETQTGIFDFEALDTWFDQLENM